MSHRNPLIACLIVLALAASGPAARAQLPQAGVVLEGSVETYTDQVIFPSTTSGLLQVRQCSGCLHPMLAMDAGTRFNLAGTSVALRDMALYCQGHPGVNLTIHYRLKDTVTSLVEVLEK